MADANCTVLVIDDDPDMLDSLTALLKDIPLEVHRASNQEEAYGKYT